MRKLSFPVAVLVLLSGCSHLKPGPVREKKVVLQRGWSYSEPPGISATMEMGAPMVSFSAPVISGEKLVYGSDRFGVIALNKFTGQKLWQRAIHNGVSSIPLVVQNKVFIGGQDAGFRALDLASGKELWKIDLGFPATGTPILVDQMIVTAAEDQTVHALDLSTGKSIWTYKHNAFSGTGIQGGANPSYIDGRIWLGFSDGSLVALDPHDGALKLEKKYRDNIKFTDINARPLAWKDGVLVASYDGKLRYLKKDMASVWEFDAGGARAPTLTDSGDTLFLPSSNGTVYALATASAKELWHYSFPHGMPTGIAYLEKQQVLLVSNSIERLAVLDATNGHELAHYDLGRGSGSFSPVAVDDESKSFFLVSNFSRVYQFRLEH